MQGSKQLLCVTARPPCKDLSCLQVKMVTADDEQTTDIIIEGDDEEATRLRKELGLAEKGKVYVKGLLENLAGEN